MKLVFQDIYPGKTKPKAAIHKTGKLGFNKEAAILMNLALLPSFKLATEEDVTEEVQRIFLLVSDTQENSAKIAKAGIYYYLNVGDVFNRLKLDYQSNTVIFDITKDAYEGVIMYVLSKRILTRNRKKKNP